MAAAGVPVAPGYHGDDQSPERLSAEARAHRLPPHHQGERGRRRQGHAGGALRGARWARRSNRRSGSRAPHSATTGCCSSAISRRPGTSRCRYSPTRRAKSCALFDRDCSVQRRHQKIIEEAPAPGLRAGGARGDGATRPSRRRARSATWARARSSSWSIESQQFYFMEMNTRLQVEHPVTELITGIDLVEWQLRDRTAASACRTSAATITRHGAAIEARLYAEDPAHDYLPSVGRIAHLRWPRRPAARPAARCGRRGGRRGVVFLRSHARQAHRLGRVAGAGGRHAASRAGRARDRRRDHQPRAAAERACRCASFRAGGVSDELSRDAPRCTCRFGEPSPQPSTTPCALWYATGERGPRRALGGYVRTGDCRRRPLTRWCFGESVVTLERLDAQHYRARLADEDYDSARDRPRGGSLEAEIGGSCEPARIIEAGAASSYSVPAGTRL